MKECPKCRCAGRVRRIDEAENKAVYICANPRCGNYREEFAEEALPKREEELTTG
jgi:hypothetical protein